VRQPHRDIRPDIRISPDHVVAARTVAVSEAYEVLRARLEPRRWTRSAPHVAGDGHPNDHGSNDRSRDVTHDSASDVVACR